MFSARVALRQRSLPAGLQPFSGAGLGSAALSATSIPLPYTLGQTSVTVNGEPAALYYAGPAQINFEFPTDLAPGSYPVVVTVNGNASAPFNVTLARARTWNLPHPRYDPGRRP